MSNSLLTKYRVNALEARMHIESASWRIVKRGFIGTLDLDEDENLLGVAREIFIAYKIRDQEILLDQRPDGRLIVIEAAFGMPILEFEIVTGE